MVIIGCLCKKYDFSFVHLNSKVIFGNKELMAD